MSATPPGKISILPSDSTWDFDDKGQPVPVEEAPQITAVTEDLDKAEVLSKNMDTALRMVMALVLAVIFIGLNVGVGILLSKAFSTDVTLLQTKIITPEQRLITEKTYLALIGATVVQVGVGIAAILAYLFPNRREKI